MESWKRFMRRFERRATKFANMEKHIYFVRHGQSESNVDGIIRGRDTKLTEKGRAQAHAVGERFTKVKLDAIITSPFTRAADTAAIIAEHLNLVPEQNDLFGEWLDSSHLIGLHRDHPLAKEGDELITSMAHDHHFRRGDEETFAELVARADLALRSLEAHSAERICVVTHGAFLIILLGVMIFGTEFKKKEFGPMFWGFQHSNTGITYAIRTEPRWEIMTWNDQSHLG